MSDQPTAAISQLDQAMSEWFGLSDVMREDCRQLLEALSRDGENQMLRRSFVRASWAYVEAITFVVKNFLAVACQFGPEHVSAEDQAFLASQRSSVNPNGDTAAERIRTSTSENVKRTFRLAASALRLDWTPEYGSEGWYRLTRSVQIRHRLTHPKSQLEVMVTASDFEDLRIGIAWFIAMFNEFQDAILERYVRHAP